MHSGSMAYPYNPCHELRVKRENFDTFEQRGYEAKIRASSCDTHHHPNLPKFQHSTSTVSSMLLLQPQQLSSYGIAESPGFLEALVDAESTLHTQHSDSETEYNSIDPATPNTFSTQSSSVSYFQSDPSSSDFSLEDIVVSNTSNSLSCLPPYESYIPLPALIPLQSLNPAQDQEMSNSDTLLLMEDSNSASDERRCDATAMTSGTSSCFILDNPETHGREPTDTSGSIMEEIGNLPMHGGRGSSPSPLPGNMISNPGSSTPLPSFQETYSPRYRRDVFNFEDQRSRSPVGNNPSNASPSSYHVTPATSPSCTLHSFHSSSSGGPPTPVECISSPYHSSSMFFSGSVSSPSMELVEHHPGATGGSHMVGTESMENFINRTPRKLSNVLDETRTSQSQKTTVTSAVSQVCSQKLTEACSQKLDGLEGLRPESLKATTIPAPSPSSSRGGATADKCCAVCGDVAACQHYGVRTCEGCKGFFKRTVQRGAKYVCMANRNCPVDKRRRNRCQFCRFQKCLSVGMVREVVRTDSLRGRRGRLPSKPRDSASGTGRLNNSPPSPPVSLITSLVRSHLDSNPNSQNIDHTKVNKFIQGERNLSQSFDKDNIINHPEQIEYFFQLLNNCFDIIRTFAEKIPGFQEFSEHDQDILLQSAYLELFVLRVAYRMKEDEESLTFCTGTALHREQCKPVFGDWYDSIMEFSRSLKAMEIDLSTMACLEALTLVTDRHALQDSSKVEQLQMKIIGSLRDHVTYSGTTHQKPYHFSRLLGKLTELRSLSVQGLQRIFYLKMEDLIPAPPAIEAMFTSTLPF